MHLLTDTTHSMTMVTGSAVSTDYVCDYADHTSTTFTPGSNQGNVSTATTTTIVAAPGASTQRQVKIVKVANRHASSSQTVQVFKVVSGSSYAITDNITLAAGQTLLIHPEGWTIRSTVSQIVVATGKVLAVNNTLTFAGTDGTTVTFPSTSATMARTDAANTFTGNQTFSGRVLVDNATDATSTTDGSLQTDGGLSVAKKIYAGGNIASSGSITANTGLFSFTAATDLNAAGQYNIFQHVSTLTQNRTGYTQIVQIGYGGSGVGPIIIPSGVTESGYVQALSISMVRDYATDQGALAELYGYRLDFGHGNTAGTGRATTTSHGMQFRPFIGVGSQTTMNVVRITAPVYNTGSVTTLNGFSVADLKTSAVTNSYAINIESQSSGGHAIKTGTGLHEFGDSLNLASGKVYKVNGTQVVAAQGAAVADATDAASAITQLNTLLARLRAHGLIAT